MRTNKCDLRSDNLGTSIWLTDSICFLKQFNEKNQLKFNLKIVSNLYRQFIFAV